MKAVGWYRQRPTERRTCTPDVSTSASRDASGGEVRIYLRNGEAGERATEHLYLSMTPDEAEQLIARLALRVRFARAPLQAQLGGSRYVEEKL